MTIMRTRLPTARHALAVAGLAATGFPEGSGVTINDPSCVNKTFPGYFDYLERLRNQQA